jgi:penicillin-binding protein 1A
VDLGSWRTPEWGWRRRVAIAAGFVVLVASILAATVAAKGPFFWYSCSLNGLQPQGQSQVSYLFGSDGTRIGVIPASRKRIPVGFGGISPLMKKAIVAAEDRRFYQDGGIDYIAIVRALAADIGAGHVSQGGSTLTQQLVRNLYLGPQRTISRKVTEACLAEQLNQKWSKQRILTTYLNDVYFGHGAYGIEAAARIYFGKHANDLTLEEAALIAGMPQAPTDYDPFNHPDAARARRAEVLKAMLDTDQITQTQYLQALRSPLGLHPGTVGVSGAGPYLTDYITSRLIDLYGAERVRRGGLRVYTTLDGKLQKAATQAIKSTLNRKGDPAGTIVSIDPRNGAIRAMAVAQTGHRLAFNIAADGRRQAGSTFKTFVLTQAVLRGINPWATKYLSAPFAGPNNWRVQTYEHTYSGRIPLTEATVLSDNTVFARLTLDLGPQPIADLAQTMGVQSPLRPVPSLGLGANPISPLDLAAAYATLASGGVRHAPSMITKVVFPDGHSASPSSGLNTRVLDPKVAAAVTKVLAENVNAGTGTAAALAGRPVAGKTGTTDNWTDAWFAGYTPQLATVSWVGYPTRERSMSDVHGIQVVGGSFPAEIWHTFMTTALQGQAVLRFPDPGSPPYHRWCGRFQFARTAAQAKPANVCPAPKPKSTQKTKTRSTETITTTAPTTTRTVQVPTTTAPKPKPPPKTTTTTTTPTTTQGSGGYQTQPDASPAVGQDGTVVKRIDSAGNGVIQVGGDYYKAISADGSTIPVGTQVTVQDAQGDTAVVQRQ